MKKTVFSYVKQHLLPALIFAVVSCGQQTSPSDRTSVDSITTNIDSDKQTQALPPTEAPDTGWGHHAYNADITGLSPAIAQFIPAGYTALDTTSGNLNLDSLPDMTLVLKKDGEEKTSDVIEHPEKRPLLILIGQPDQTYKLAARSDNAVYCIDCGGIMGDPFMDVVIKNGFFSVEHYGGSNWRWERTVTFRYSAADNYWYLHKDGSASWSAVEPGQRTTEIRTTKDFGKLRFDQFDIYEDQ